MLLHAVLLCLHLLAATVWVGGMAVMHLAVRPAALQTLDPQARLGFMAAALSRFFAAVNVAIVVLLLTGLAMMQRGGFGAAHWSVHAMLALGLLMMAVYLQIRLALHPQLLRAVAERRWSEAATQLAAIRVRVVLNLMLGIVVYVLALVARAW